MGNLKHSHRVVQLKNDDDGLFCTHFGLEKSPPAISGRAGENAPFGQQRPTAASKSWWWTSLSLTAT